MDRGEGDTQRVAVELRRAIREGELLPGEAVRQELWASKLSVSRVPIREALKLLSGECIVHHDHNRGYFVTKLDAAEMAQIYSMRILLEPEVLRSVRDIDEAVISSLQKMTDDTVGLLCEKRVVEAVEIDRHFYYSIYELSGLNYMVAEVERLWGMADAYRIASIQVELEVDPMASEFRRRHQKIIRAIASGDREELVRIVVDERMGVLSRLSSRMPPQGASGSHAGTPHKANGVLRGGRMRGKAAAK